MIHWFISSLLCGLLFFILFLFAFYWVYIKDLPKTEQVPVKPQFEDFFITTALQDLLVTDQNGSVAALNVLLQFLFQELKDSGSVRHYIIRKMTAEFKELLTTKAIGKMIEKITARDFSLGTSCPLLSNLKLQTFKTDKSKSIIHEFAATFDVDYVDGFSISVDVDLILGRCAYAHIKIASIKGRMRMYFTREPFCHWYLAFVDDPDIQFSVSSHFENKQIPQLTTLIINQLRRSVKKKHTLPNYKIRYKPFFDQIVKPSTDDTRASQQMAAANNRNSKLPTYINSSNGKLVVNLENFDHFSQQSSLLQYHDLNVFMTIGLDSYSFDWLLTQKTNANSWPKYEIEIVRQNLIDPIGIGFVEVFFHTQQELVVHRILSNTPASAHQAAMRQFDILVSINGTKATSLKTINLLIKKSLTLKMQFKRPQLFASENENAVNQVVNNNNKPIVQPISQASVTSVPDSLLNSSSDSDSTAFDNNPCEESSKPTSATSPTKEEDNEVLQQSILQQPSQLATLTSIVNSTQRFKERLFNGSFRRTNPVQLGSFTDATQATMSPSKQNFQLAVPATPAATTSAPITNYASTSSLLEFYCEVLFNSTEGNSNDIDFVHLITTNLNNQKDSEQRHDYYKKTKKLKLDTNNTSFLNFNEQYEFDLNDNTKHVNICLWVHTLFRTKPKTILVGYISIPISDINAECWSTMKGEAKQTCFFKPIETKASANARTHTQVLSRHPGFDASCTYGAVTLTFQHVIADRVPGEMTKTLLIKNAVHGIIENFIKIQDDNQSDLGPYKSTQNASDKYSHKFISYVQYNETVFCGYCSKKIWFKNAYRCACCSYIIHVKCYEKAITTTICPIYMKSSDLAANDATDQNTIKSTVDVVNGDETPTKHQSLDDTALLTTAEKSFTKKTDSSNPGQIELLSGSKRAAVLNIITGLRQRKWTRTKDKFQNSANNKLGDDFEVVSKGGDQLADTIVESHGVDADSDSIDTFQDAQVDFLCDDKSMGIQLCDDLPLTERKLKLEEMIFKYQSSLDMMKRLKDELENDLKVRDNGRSAANDTKLKQQIKLQISHLEDQMKSVMFLLMQCQVGLEHCQELLTGENPSKED